MTDEPFVLEPGRLSLAGLRRIERKQTTIELSPECRAAVEQSRDLVNAIVDAGTPTYGVNTGLGTLSSRRIAPEDLEEMQSRLLLSNAAGTGALLSEAVVRRLMLLKINTLARGRSGVRPELIGALVSLYNAGVAPCIPSKSTSRERTAITPPRDRSSSLRMNPELGVSAFASSSGVPVKRISPPSAPPFGPRSTI